MTMMQMLLGIGEVYASVEYLVIAGGGGAGYGNDGGGGGAGGYRSSIEGELSGQNTAAEAPRLIEVGRAYTVTVGAGGVGGSIALFADEVGSNGSDSVFGPIVSEGGGGGGGGTGRTGAGSLGGSGGGGGDDSIFTGGAGTAGQGFAGGNFAFDPVTGLGTHAGGGGGAGGPGGSGNDPLRPAYGGAGIGSSVTGTALERAGGGGGGINTPGIGIATGGGGSGSTTSTVIAGVPNTGGGGGGSGVNATGGRGGSGIVILKYSTAFNLTHTAGLTSSTVVIGNFNITTFTAGTGTMTLNLV